MNMSLEWMFLPPYNKAIVTLQETERFTKGMHY